MTVNTEPNNKEKVLVDDPVASEPQNTRENTKDSFENRKHEPDIDGPQQDSQETDEIYSDPREEENLPAGGKNVADLNAHDLSKNNNT